MDWTYTVQKVSRFKYACTISCPPSEYTTYWWRKGVAEAFGKYVIRRNNAH